MRNSVIEFDVELFARSRARCAYVVVVHTYLRIGDDVRRNVRGGLTDGHDTSHGYGLFRSFGAFLLARQTDNDDRSVGCVRILNAFLPTHFSRRSFFDFVEL